MGQITDYISRKHIKKIYINPLPTISKKEAIHIAAYSTKKQFFGDGLEIKQFENEFKQYTNNKYAISFAKARIGLYTILQALNIKQGDEVILPAYTCVVVPNALRYHGIIPKYVDINPQTYNMNIEQVKKAITKKTKAIIAHHIYGQPCDIAELQEIAKKHNLYLIEDAAQSLGASYKNKKVGNFGVMGSFSFYFGHHISTIEGGMITTDDLETYDLLKSIRSHGWIRDSLRMKHYEKEYSNLDYIFDYMGYNVRSTNLNAAIGIEQLKKIDSSIRIRKNNHRIFNELMLSNKKVKLQGISLSANSSFCLPLIVPTKEYRDNLLIKLREHGIESRSVVGGSLVKQPVFVKKLKGKYRADVCPNAETIDLCGLYLPNNQFIDEEKVKYMAEKINVILDGGVPF